MFSEHEIDETRVSEMRSRAQQGGRMRDSDREPRSRRTFSKIIWQVKSARVSRRKRRLYCRLEVIANGSAVLIGRCWLIANMLFFWWSAIMGSRGIGNYFPGDDCGLCKTPDDFECGHDSLLE